MRGQQSDSGSVVAWLALALAIVATVVAVVAYYRSGGPPLEQEVAREVSKATTVLRSQISEIERATEEARRELERRSLAADAREALLSARAEIERRGDVGQIRRDLASARDDLQAMFEGESGGAGERWQSFRADLERAESAVGENVDEAFAAVSAALARLDGEIGPRDSASSEPEPERPEPSADDATRP